MKSKVISILVIFTVCLIALTGCSKNEEIANATYTSSTADEVKNEVVENKTENKSQRVVDTIDYKKAADYLKEGVYNG